MEAKLDVGNLADTTSKEDLRRLFTQAGAVAAVVMLKDRDTGLLSGRAVITMASRADTRKAIGMFDDYRLGERSMTVNLTRPRMARASGRPH
jgi:RNA recognition motif-containing protein